MSAPAVALPKELKTYSGQPLKFRNALGSELNGSSNYYAVFSPKGYFSHQGSNTGSTAMEGMVPSNLWVDLHQSEKLITVDVWERIG